jgi:hypothetical protein
MVSPLLPMQNSLDPISSEFVLGGRKQSGRFEGKFVDPSRDDFAGKREMIQQNKIPVVCENESMIICWK